MKRRLRKKLCCGNFAGYSLNGTDWTVVEFTTFDRQHIQAVIADICLKAAQK